MLDNHANENGGVGSWGAMRVRSSKFQTNYALRGAAIIVNRKMIRDML